jgi:hypothetical protein
MWTEWLSEFTLSARPDFARDFPHLKPEFCVNGISPATRDYNCFAWAAHVTDVRWEPDPFLQYYWPDVAPRECSIPAYRPKGFEACNDESLEPETEKIVIYTLEGTPNHVARQLENGNRTSKMGDYEDIQRTLLTCIRDRLLRRSR